MFVVFTTTTLLVSVAFLPYFHSASSYLLGHWNSVDKVEEHTHTHSRFTALCPGLPG